MERALLLVKKSESIGSLAEYTISKDPNSRQKQNQEPDVPGIFQCPEQFLHNSFSYPWVISWHECTGKCNFLQQNFTSKFYGVNKRGPGHSLEDNNNHVTCTACFKSWEEIQIPVSAALLTPGIQIVSVTLCSCDDSNLWGTLSGEGQLYRGGPGKFAMNGLAITSPIQARKPRDSPVFCSFFSSLHRQGVEEPGFPAERLVWSSSRGCKQGYQTHQL